MTLDASMNTSAHYRTEPSTISLTPSDALGAACAEKLIDSWGVDDVDTPSFFPPSILCIMYPLGTRFKPHRPNFKSLRAMEPERNGSYRNLAVALAATANAARHVRPASGLLEAHWRHVESSCSTSRMYRI